MALEFIKEPASDDEPAVEISERLCLTEDGKLVVEGDPAARWLYAIPGARVPRAEAEKYGLLKQRRQPANKQRGKPAAKED